MKKQFKHLATSEIKQKDTNFLNKRFKELALRAEELREEARFLEDKDEREDNKYKADDCDAEMVRIDEELMEREGLTGNED